VRSLFLLIESARAFSFWPIKDSSGTFVDSHVLLRDNLYFIASASIDIDSRFYEETCPKYPLSITKTLDYLGKSSSAITSVLECPSQSFPYATCRIQTVLVDSKTRKPMPYPDWWREKYAPYIQGGQPMIMPQLEKTGDVHRYTTKVSYSDIDAYLHTNWQSYVSFCMEAFYDNVFHHQNKQVDREIMGKRLKSFEAGFRKESSMGDELDVYSWKSNEVKGEIQFEIKHEEDVCLHAKMNYHES
jgi:acyl-CoA thioesterase FadM